MRKGSETTLKGLIDSSPRRLLVAKFSSHRERATDPLTRGRTADLPHDFYRPAKSCPSPPACPARPPRPLSHSNLCASPRLKRARGFFTPTRPSPSQESNELASYRKKFVNQETFLKAVDSRQQTKSSSLSNQIRAPELGVKRYAIQFSFKIIH